MTDQINQMPKFYALLIGIDYYIPNRLSDGSSYRNLRGCVRDINHVEAYLLNTLKVPGTQLFKLTASNGDNSITPKEPPEQWPTYKNIVAKFEELTQVADKDDLVYIHYSGHGGRTKTNYSKVKGNDGVDEALVPTDIGEPEGQYLRDLELAKILQRMVDKGLVVTVVLDSCHSGGATKGVDADVRGLDVIDQTPRPNESLVAPPEELMATWENLAGGTRNITAASGWLPEPKGYTLLAACRENELAYEYAFDGNERSGALSYWLLDSLMLLGTGVTYKTLHNRLLAKIHTQFERQTPMLQGEGDRTIFKSISASSHPTVPVIQVDVTKNRVQLQAGQAQGLRKGAEFAIYPLNTLDFSQTDKLALVKITQLGAAISWAEITELLGETKIEDIQSGSPAVLLNPGVKLIRKVSILPPEKNNQTFGIDTHAGLTAIESAITEGKGWVEVSNDKDSDYQVTINAVGEYEILRSGTAIANLRPALKVDDRDAAVNLVKRLVHLSKYYATLDLKNHDTTSPLQGKIKVELCQIPEDYEPGDKLELIPFNAPGNVPILDVNQFACLRIRNEGFQTLNITVLAIQADWSIVKGYPSGAAYQPLAPGQEITWRIQTSLPQDVKEGTDVLKVFATIDATSFDWLEIPALDKTINGKNPDRAANPLEKLMAAFATEEAPPKKNVSSAAYASEGWTTEQVELYIKQKV
ncbi:peptidase C14 [Scytonema hofmannii PCC 7110]|uniref:Peptidase C14 n=1 Tax=Scytonema hofmannii PCC 7110 TaxID=128403 RepID=A0A139XES8_9CYAN|nr:caspase family protein [Scytonema hofmannii]KYC43197.1 peptidase C14 [Scytonema hofmannii PCC 7110]